MQLSQWPHCRLLTDWQRNEFLSGVVLVVLSVVEDHHDISCLKLPSLLLFGLTILMVLEEPIPPFSEEQVVWIEGLVKKTAEADKGTNKSGT